MPLRCSLKEFLSWAVILWTTSARALDDWNAIAEQVGLQRRTLERSFNRMAGCTLGEAAEDPERVVGRFYAWVDSVWDPGSGNGPVEYDRVTAGAPTGQRS